MIERITELCKKKNTNFSRLEKELGFANASLKKADGKMQACRLKALADYFNVSMEYLLTGSEENKNYVISDFEYKLIVNYRQSEHKAAILHLLNMTEEAAKEKEGVITA